MLNVYKINLNYYMLIIINLSSLCYMINSFYFQDKIKNFVSYKCDQQCNMRLLWK